MLANEEVIANERRRPGEEGVRIEEVVTPHAPRELLHRPHRAHSVKPFVANQTYRSRNQTK